MKCDNCGCQRSGIAVSHCLDNGSVYRRRTCTRCGSTWTTIEMRRETLKNLALDISASAAKIRDSITGTYRKEEDSDDKP